MNQNIYEDEPEDFTNNVDCYIKEINNPHFNSELTWTESQSETDYWNYICNDETLFEQNEYLERT